MALGGVLASDSGSNLIVIDIAGMYGDWGTDVRKDVIDRVFHALCKALGVNAPNPGWWVNFRIIEEGSWGAYGSVVSIETLMKSGVFTPEKAKAIRAKLAAQS